jgi:hypothetical protein
MKQTAVDWLFEQLWETPKDKLNWYSILKQANQMEREQIIDAYKEGCFDNILSEKTDKIRAEQYYNETFGK